MDFTISQGDDLPVVQANLTNSDGSYISFTNASGVKFVYFNKSRAFNPITGAAIVLGDTSGFIQYSFDKNQISGGYWYGRWQINYSGAGARLSIPNDGYILFNISKDIL